MVILGVGEIVAITLAGATLLHSVAKDAFVYAGRKASYSKNLKENYEALEWELNFLLGFRTDIERMIRRRHRRYRETYERWNSQVKQIHEQTSSCLATYEQIRKSSFYRRANLSKRMVELYQKIVQLRGEGKDLARSISALNKAWNFIDICKYDLGRSNPK